VAVEKADKREEKQNNKTMRRFSEDKFFMPTQLDVGTPQKDVTDALETPIPLAKGYDGMPKFNELNESQKKNMPKAMRSQVAFQQKKLQYSNYQIINFKIQPSDSAVSQDYYFNSYDIATTINTVLGDGVLFGTSTADVTKAKYYNIVYLNARYIDAVSGAHLLENPSFVEFWAMQKLTTGDFGGKIPRQIEAIDKMTNSIVIESGGVEFAQAFGVDVYNENAYYTQSPDLKGIRTCGLALKRINLNFGVARTLSGIRLDVEIAIDLKTEGNNL